MCRNCGILGNCMKTCWVFLMVLIKQGSPRCNLLRQLPGLGWKELTQQEKISAFLEDCSCCLDTASMSYCLLFCGCGTILWNDKSFLKICIQSECTGNESRQAWYSQWNFPSEQISWMQVAGAFCSLFVVIWKKKKEVLSSNWLSAMVRIRCVSHCTNLKSSLWGHVGSTGF